MMPPPCNEMIPPGRRACWPSEFLPPAWSFGSSRFGGLASGAAEALAGEVEAVGVVDEAVEDGVGVGGVADEGRASRRQGAGW